MYTILHLGQALAQNIQTLLITRFLGGFFAVAPLVNAGGNYILPLPKKKRANSFFQASLPISGMSRDEEQPQACLPPASSSDRVSLFKLLNPTFMLIDYRIVMGPIVAGL
jgi:hypothetical protein